MDGGQDVGAIEDVWPGLVEAHDGAEVAARGRQPVGSLDRVGGRLRLDGDGQRTIWPVAQARGAVPDRVPADGIGDQVVVRYVVHGQRPERAHGGQFGEGDAVAPAAGA